MKWNGSGDEGRCRKICRWREQKGLPGVGDQREREGAENSRGPAKDQNYRGSIQLASRHVKYYCLARFIHSIFKRGERKALRRPPNIFHY